MQIVFSADELERYARHFVLRDIGGPGQQRLKQARVLVIGAGGLGAPLLLYLAAAGIGTIGIADDDRVSLSNLQRQVIHSSADVERSKTASASDAIKRLNPHVKIVTHDIRINADNASSTLMDYDVIADGSDNFETRYLISDLCFELKKPLVTAALGAMDATLTTIRAHERNSNGEWNPTYRCLFPAVPPVGTVPTCAEAGVLGALAGAIGSLMALEVIRAIIGFGESLVGRLLMFDAHAMRFETIEYKWDPENPLSGTHV